MKLLTIAVVAVALLCGSLPMAAASSAEADQPLPWVTPTGGLVWVWVFGIIFTLLGYAVAGHTIWGHYRWWNHGKVQQYIVRMLYTMPVYGTVGLLTILFPNCFVTLILIRTCWNAYMVLQFVNLLIAYFTPHGTIEMREINMVKVLEHIGKQRAKPPCCCCGMLHPGKAYLVDKVLLPVKVFAFMAPLLSIIGELFDQYNMYSFGAMFSFDRAFFWLNIATVLFTMWALSGLFTFFQLVEPLVKDAKNKNICIQLVLGPMVIQEVVIGIIAGSGGLDDGLFGIKHPGVASLILLNFLYTIESFVFGLLFAKTFGFETFHSFEVSKRPMHSSTADGLIHLPNDLDIDAAAFVDVSSLSERERAASVARTAKPRLSRLMPSLRGANLATEGIDQTHDINLTPRKTGDGVNLLASDGTAATAAATADVAVDVAGDDDGGDDDGDATGEGAGEGEGGSAAAGAGAGTTAEPATTA